MLKNLTAFAHPAPIVVRCDARFHEVVYELDMHSTMIQLPILFGIGWISPPRMTFAYLRLCFWCHFRRRSARCFSRTMLHRSVYPAEI